MTLGVRTGISLLMKNASRKYCHVCYRQFSGNPVNEKTMVSDEVIIETDGKLICQDCHLKGVEDGKSK